MMAFLALSEAVTDVMYAVVDPRIRYSWLSKHD